MGISESKLSPPRRHPCESSIKLRSDLVTSATTVSSHSDSSITIEDCLFSQHELEVESLHEAIAAHHEKTNMNKFDLVASNSFCSEEVRKIMGSSLMNSYCIGLPGSRFYGGCKEIDEIEIKTRELVCEVYGAKYCETPWITDGYNVDIEALPLAMETHEPTLLILGWSEMLFEHDLPAIRKICDDYGCKILYDMSHVAGLIARGAFQCDMMQYADIVTSSTGKSLHSSDHGLILYNDPSLTPKIREAVMPLLTSNTHFHETAALAMTMIEMKAFGEDYARQVVSNTKALAKELISRKFKLLCSDLGYSNSHELILDLENVMVGPSGAQATKLLDAAGVSVNPQELPHDTVEATGLRLGTQVLTRRGFKEADMAAVAVALENVLMKKTNPASVSSRVARKCAPFQNKVSYAFGSTLSMGFGSEFQA